MREKKGFLVTLRRYRRGCLKWKKGLACLALLFQCVSVASGRPLISEDQLTGWEVLFGGESTVAWREVGSQDFPGDVWVVQDGCLRLLPNTSDGKDLISLKQYGDFELRFEWNISEGGNSGIKYMVQEGEADPDQARLRRWALVTAFCFLLLSAVIGFIAFKWRKSLLMIVFGGVAAGLSLLSFYGAFRFSQSIGNAVGLEFQLYDDSNIEVPNKNLSSGALYDLIAPVANAVRPPGEFNQGRILVRGPHVEHWINGIKILDYELDSEFLRERIANSKFHRTPQFGQKSPGHISLQNHRDEIWFRDIRICPL